MKNILIIIGLIILILQIIYVGLNNKLSTLGPNQAKLELQLSRVKDENNALKNEILEAESLHIINQKALQDGFMPAEYIYESRKNNNY